MVIIKNHGNKLDFSHEALALMKIAFFAITLEFYHEINEDRYC